MRVMQVSRVFCVLSLGLLAACDKSSPGAEPQNTQQALDTKKEPTASELREKAAAMFGALPDRMESAERPITQEKVQLGKTLYFDPRLSKNQELSCASCHDLSSFGIEPRADSVTKGTSMGHKGQFGDRNSPSVFNAASHIAQFWDGRAKDVEEQAKGPILNPVEMAMPDEASVVAVLKSIPGYEPMFKAAFPKDADAISYDNMAQAIGAFERTLVTPGPFDKFIKGDDAALSKEQLAGLDAFIDTGCMACHMGPAFGGAMFQKLGLIKPFDTQDEGRAKITGNAADKHVFKVPSLRNVEKTGPYFHDGSVKTLAEAVKIMAKHQTPAGEIPDEKVTKIVAFLGSLTGDEGSFKIDKPELPPSGPKTPKPIVD